MTASKDVSRVNTGTVNNNNNDHVISFNGKMLGLSSSVDSLGGSIIYMVPISGGIPRQITPKGPSYLHGWSPDGNRWCSVVNEMANLMFIKFPQVADRKSGLQIARDWMMVLNIAGWQIYLFQFSPLRIDANMENETRWFRPGKGNK